MGGLFLLNVEKSFIIYFRQRTHVHGTVQRRQLIQHALKLRQAVGQTFSVVNFTKLAKQINEDKPLTEYDFAMVVALLFDIALLRCASSVCPEAVTTWNTVFRNSRT
jgi:hypothetical protein